MESKAAPAAVRFGDLAFDIEKGALVRGGKQHYLRPKATALLRLLATQLGRVVSKQEMFDTAWPGVFVTEDSLVQAIREIRKAIGDDDQSILRNVSRRGYILVGDAPETRSDRAQPVVAFFRCANETGNASLTPIIDGFVEEVMNGLARFGTVAVLARQTSFLFNSSDQESWKLARANFGADYLVEGTARPSANGFRITGNLVDATTLKQLTSMSFEANAETIFDVQNNIAELVISTLERRVADFSVQRTYRRPIEDLVSYELLLRGVAVSRANTYESYAEGEKLLEAAVARDPSSGLALAQLANVQVMKAGYGRAKREDLDRILITANKAVALAPEQSVAHRVLSFIQMYRHEHGAAEHYLRRSLDLNPYDAESLEQMGYLMTLRGKPVEAMQWMDRAVRLNPIHPEWYEHDRSFALYMLGEYRKAAEAIELSSMPPPWMLTWLAACYAQMGEIETARQHIARVTEVDPRFSSIDFARGNGAAFEHPSDNDHFAEGVFLALGIPME